MTEHIYIFGDSITWGAWDTKTRGWVGRLKDYFEKNGTNVRVYKRGVSGFSTRELLKEFGFKPTEPIPTIIIFAVGINDSYYLGSKDKVNVTIDDFEKNLRELYDRARKFCSKIIFVGLTPIEESKTKPLYWEPTVYHDNENNVLYNSKIVEMCQNNNVPFISMLDVLDITDIKDGIHPNPSGHEKMFVKVRDFLIFNKFV